MAQAATVSHGRPALNRVAHPTIYFQAALAGSTYNNCENILFVRDAAALATLGEMHEAAQTANTLGTKCKYGRNKESRLGSRCVSC